MNDRETAMDISESHDRILIVDDEPSMRTALMSPCVGWDMEVQGATDVSMVLELGYSLPSPLVITGFRRCRASPDWILWCDIKARAPQTVISPHDGLCDRGDRGGCHEVRSE